MVPVGICENRLIEDWICGFGSCYKVNQMIKVETHKVGANLTKSNT